MEFDNNSTNSNNTFQENAHYCSVIAKMRRLKIQEDLILQAIKKNISNASVDGDNIFIKVHLEFKKFLSKLKKNHADIKLLFGDLKSTTESQDILKTLDLDDIKKDVLELEEKIKSFKVSLQVELIELKKSEKDLLKQLDGDSETMKIKKYAKVTKKTFSDIVQSPVKLIINRPFKYPEVQQFLDFNKSNKFGGWNEYNHNIFGKIWKKHFQTDEYLHADKINYIEQESFVDEVYEKISGVKKKDVICHMKWYTNYLHLKKRQQIALNEWRTKTKPKKVPDNDRMFESGNCRNNFRSLDKYSVDKSYFSDDSVEYSTNAERKKVFDGNVIKCVRNGLSEENKILYKVRFNNPTRQWINRCSSASDLQAFGSINVDNIKKLGIPSWRIGLKEQDFQT